nr:PAS domain-containing protein [Pseudomonadota bacterium]
MKPKAAGAAHSDDHDPQLAALIETLHETGKRLEELTGGEVDSVVAPDGRAFLLQHAQDQLRNAGAAKQAGIIDALPASIALLDPRGTIFAVNEAWRRFAVANQALLPGHGVGINYLTVCDHARGAGSSEASRVAGGMRKVLSAAEPGFSMEYSCHSPTEQRWFLMTISPLAGTPPSGAVVMHVNITARKLAEAQLQRFVLAMDSVADQIYITDRATLLFVHVNDAACRMQGKTREQLLALGPA